MNQELKVWHCTTKKELRAWVGGVNKKLNVMYN